MKKLLIIAVLLVIALVPVISQSNPLGNLDASKFATGRWLDAKYGALWQFDVNGIKLLWADDQELIYSFFGKVEDIKLEPSGNGMQLYFTCEDTEREYTFDIKNNSSEMELIVKRENGERHQIIMEKQ